MIINSASLKKYKYFIVFIKLFFIIYQESLLLYIYKYLYYIISFKNSIKHIIFNYLVL